MEQPIDVCCCAVRTSGTATGVRNALDKAGSLARVVILGAGFESGHLDGAAGDQLGLLPQLLDLDRFDEVRAISEGGAFGMARRLAAEEGLLAGGSTGLNVTDAIELAKEIGAGKTVVTLACDTGLEYSAGDLYRR